MSTSIAGSPAMVKDKQSQVLCHIMTVVLVVTAFVWQMHMGMNPDTTWLTVMAERWLDGEQLYRDLQENNPPASVYLYVPAVYFARILAVRSEFAVVILTFLLTAGCFAAGYVMMRRARLDQHFHMPWLLTAATALLVVMPASSFAQREHIAAIMTLPVIALGPLRASGQKPEAWMVVLAGLFIGLITAIKPPLALIAIFISLLAARHARSWLPIFAMENWIGAATVLFYSVAVFIFHPEFLRDVVPLLDDVYLPNRFMAVLFLSKFFYVILVLIFSSLIMHRHELFTPPVSLVYAAAAGFFVSYILQMKFFDYHALPVVIFLLLGLILCLVRIRSQTNGKNGTHAPPTGKQVMSLVLVLLSGLTVTYLCYDAKRFNGNLTNEIRTISKSAKVLGFGAFPGPQILSVRDAGGQWVGSFGYTYVPRYAVWFREQGIVGPQWASKLEFWERWTAEISARDINTKKPDVILLRDEKDPDWRTWIQNYPVLKNAMLGYQFYHKVNVGEGVNPVLLYVRKSPAPKP